MKKWFALMASLCLLLVCGAALADDVTVSFAGKSGSMNGGYAYTLTVNAKPAPAADLTVTVQSEDTDKRWEAVIPAGATSADMTIDLDVVEKTTKTVLTFAEGDGYAIQKNAKHTLSVLPLPKVQFYLGANFGSVGDQMTVQVICNNPSSVCKSNNVFELRDTDGTPLDTSTWKNAKNKLSFTFDVTEDMNGRHDFTVWLGDREVSTHTGYGSVSNGEKVVYSLEPTVPLMGIGIDCAYNADRTDEILAILDKHDVKVTFFMTGYFMRTFTEEARKIVAAGHEIGNHSRSHPHLPTLSTSEILNQLTSPIESAEELLGVTPRLVRPPYGEFNRYVTSIARSEGMEVIMWNATAHDSTFKYTHEQVLRFATTGTDFKPGSILLMHLDGLGSPLTLDTALPYYKSIGLQVAPISAVLYASGKELPEMPDGHEALVFTNEYWENYLANNLPEYAPATSTDLAE